MWFVLLVACGSPGEAPPAAPSAAVVPVEAPAPPPPPAAPERAAVAIPPDGKLERVKVEGVTVPMINLMDDGSVVLVDTDGVKPRSWEEQYKRKGDLPKGWFSLHKTNANHDDGFEDDAIDREGLWRMDEQGNLTRE